MALFRFLCGFPFVCVFWFDLFLKRKRLVVEGDVGGGAIKGVVIGGKVVLVFSMELPAMLFC